MLPNDDPNRTRSEERNPRDMDTRGAKKLAESLLNSLIGGWRVLRAINHGKSAVVFEAKRGRRTAALKVFDPELIEEHGRDKQLNRVKREQTLRGHKHPHLVKILDGGECPKTKHVYIVMEHIASPNLAAVRANVPDSQIALIISQIAGAARYLDKRGFAHRDIKPENIAVDASFSHATLLDLGVIRPTMGSSLTDGTAGKEFIATLRYSSPTYLFRDDDGSPESLKALTFYQLGGVLHDLIMKEELFAGRSKPWTRLVRAIQQETPRVDRDGVNPRLCILARNCLVKSDDARLAAVDWEDFTLPVLEAENIDRLRRRVLRRIPPDDPSVQESESSTEDSISDALGVLRALVRAICSSDVFPPIVFAEPTQANGIGELRLTLSADEHRRLDRSITVCFKVRLLEASSGTFEFLWASAVGGGRPCEAPPPAWFSMYTGPLDSPLLNAGAEETLLRTVDFAQSHFKGSANPFCATNDGDPMWFQHKAGRSTP